VPSVVMVVEDEFFVALDIEDILMRLGYEMAGPYPTVREAGEGLSAQTPDCAILDVRLKDGDVFPVADALHAAHVPIVFHSGHADDRELRRRYPTALICAKPSSPSSLQTAIEAAMASS
jgi:two-component system, response regulator PdtaR